jgi:hypothetical protein
MNDYAAKILADSLSPEGIRLTTFEVTFPRFILAEFNTHRMLSRNSASSRAIPTEKLLKRVIDTPFVPSFNKRVKGMGVGEALEGDDAKYAVDFWKTARTYMTQLVEKLQLLDVDKSRVNRLLEPFMWHTAIVSATEWSNFFALRNNPEAQPEFGTIASMMQELLETNEPYHMDHGEWHLPLIHKEDYAKYGHVWPEYGLYTGDWDTLKKISVGRCARVSYLTHDGQRDHAADIELHDRLMASGHMSPFEHVATPIQFGRGSSWSGNYFGWHQYRKEIPNEADFGRVLQEQA